MIRMKKDEIREERIIMEVIVDAYNAQEQAMGWYYYLSDNISFPFRASCISAVHKSPLQVGEEVDVMQMASYSGSIVKTKIL